MGVRGYLEPVFSFGAQNGPNEAAAIQGEKRPTPSPLPNPFRTLSEVFPNPWTAAGNDTRQAAPEPACGAFGGTCGQRGGDSHTAPVLEARMRPQGGAGEAIQWAGSVYPVSNPGSNPSIGEHGKGYATTALFLPGTQELVEERRRRETW
jgi:hypothetical protein